MITGIKWVSELIEIAGGTDVFSTLSSNDSANDRVVTSEEVIEAAPDIIIASWCGKKVRPETFRREKVGLLSQRFSRTEFMRSNHRSFYSLDLLRSQTG